MEGGDILTSKVQSSRSRWKSTSRLELIPPWRRLYFDRCLLLVGVFLVKMHKLELRRFFSLPFSRTTGHYTVQQIQNSYGERLGSSSSSSSTPLPVPKPSSASYPGCRSRPGSSPRHSPNFRSRLQPAWRHCNSQVETKFMFTSVYEQFHGGGHSLGDTLSLVKKASTTG